MVQKVNKLKTHLRENKDLYLAVGVFFALRMPNKQPKFQQFIIVTDAQIDNNS